MLCSRLKGGTHEYIDRRASTRTQRCRFGANPVPIHHPHGPGGGGRLFHHRRRGLYTSSSRGLHPYVGFLVAWGFILAEPIVAPLLYLVFGNELAANLHSHFGWPVWLWAPFAVVAGLIVWFLTYRGIRLSTGTGV